MNRILAVLTDWLPFASFLTGPRHVLLLRWSRLQVWRPAYFQSPGNNAKGRTGKSTRVVSMSYCLTCRRLHRHVEDPPLKVSTYLRSQLEVIPSSILKSGWCALEVLKHSTSKIGDRAALWLFSSLIAFRYGEASIGEQQKPTTRHWHHVASQGTSCIPTRPSNVGSRLRPHVE